nr:retrotransposon Gag domain, retroviral aspartyl protease [Tanacetum cinerariifolium]
MKPVFVGNFEYETRQSNLERLFGRYGRVDRVDIKSGYAFVYFEDERDAEDAIHALDNSPFGYDRRRLSVEWARGERGRHRDGSNKILDRVVPVEYALRDDGIETCGDPRGWLMKAEKYFRYYQIPDEEKEELVQAFTRSFSSAEFQNPDDFLCSIKQTSSKHEYRQEFAKRSFWVSNWPDHCLLGEFLNGLKDELKSDVRIHKPRTVYSTMSLALEFKYKLATHRPGKNAFWTPNSKSFQSDPKPIAFTPIPTSTQLKYTPRIPDTEKQNRFLKGECFRCSDNYRPGHRCKTGTLKVLEAEEDMEEPPVTQFFNPDFDQEETVEISLHAILAKPYPTTMKVRGHRCKTGTLKVLEAEEDMEEPPVT